MQQIFRNRDLTSDHGPWELQPGQRIEMSNVRSFAQLSQAAAGSFSSLHALEVVVECSCVR